MGEEVQDGGERAYTDVPAPPACSCGQALHSLECAYAEWAQRYC